MSKEPKYGCNQRKLDPQPPERNKPCPCGSKKKFKRCCGEPAKLALKNQIAWAPPTVGPQEAALHNTKNSESPVQGEVRKSSLTPPMRRIGLTVMAAALALGGGYFDVLEGSRAPRRRGGF